MVELRKRKDPPPSSDATATAAAARKPKASKTAAAAVAKVKAKATAQTSETKTTEKKAGSKDQECEVGTRINLDGFGGDVETSAGDATTLLKLLEGSKAGVVLFTYPKASTPGCTTQAQLFRDSHAELTSTGLSIYGLSRDSPKANANFKTKQNLPYELLCDPSGSLVRAIGFAKAPKGTQRGVVVFSKEGQVLERRAGGPAATVEVVKALVEKK